VNPSARSFGVAVITRAGCGSPQRVPVAAARDLAHARRRADSTRRLAELDALRQERFELTAQLAERPDDMVFYTQITMEAAEDPTVLNAMKRARILGALVGVVSVTEEGLKPRARLLHFRASLNGVDFDLKSLMVEATSTMCGTPARAASRATDHPPRTA
jgi:hypothetical protein